MLRQRTSLSVQAEANTSQVPLWKEKNTSLLLFFHSCLLFSQTRGPRILVVQLRHQRNQNAKLLERDRQLCSWDTGANFQSSKYCRTRCSGSFTQVRSCVWYLRNSCCGVNAVRESREKKKRIIHMRQKGVQRGWQPIKFSQIHKQASYINGSAAISNNSLIWQKMMMDTQSCVLDWYKYYNCYIWSIITHCTDSKAFAN